MEDARALAKVASLAFTTEVLVTQKATHYRSDEGLGDVGRTDRAGAKWWSVRLLVLASIESYEHVFLWILDPHIHLVASFDKKSKHPPVTHFWALSFRGRLWKGRPTRKPGSRHGKLRRVSARSDGSR